MSTKTTIKTNNSFCITEHKINIQNPYIFLTCNEKFKDKIKEIISFS